MIKYISVKSTLDAKRFDYYNITDEFKEWVGPRLGAIYMCRGIDCVPTLQILDKDCAKIAFLVYQDQYLVKSKSGDLTVLSDW